VERMTKKAEKIDWDDIMSGINGKIIAEARKEPGLALKLAVAVLDMGDGDLRIAHWNPEYGDGEATARMKEFIEEAHPLLEHGEKLYFRLVDMTVDQGKLR